MCLGLCAEKTASSEKKLLGALAGMEPISKRAWKDLRMWDIHALGIYAIMSRV